MLDSIELKYFPEVRKVILASHPKYKKTNAIISVSEKIHKPLVKMQRIKGRKIAHVYLHPKVFPGFIGRDVIEGG